MFGQDCEQLTLFQAGSRASRLVQPGSAEARKMTVTSGLKCCELLKNCSPLGLLVKTLLESSVWQSTRCFLIWKPQATKQGRLWFQLVVSMPRTEDIVSPFWATPNTMDHLPQRSPEALKRQAETSRKGRSRPANLREQVNTATMMMWPTPSASDCGRIAINPHLTRNGTIRHIGKDGTQSFARLDQVAAMFPNQKAAELNGETGGTLNPTWVEWLMGFPIGWTDLNA